MEHKSYNTVLEIIWILLKGPGHVRGMARALGINHMSVSRGIKTLIEQNVLDYREDGRNKVFFLKKTSEARSFAIMAESYRLVRALEKYPELRKIAESMQADGRIGIAMIFGSYAKGLAKKGSDIDLYVETQDAKLKRDIAGLDPRLSVKAGSFDREGMLAKEIMKNHIIVKGIEEFYGKAGILG